MNLTRRPTMLKLRRLFTSPPARYTRMRIRRELREYAEAGIRSNPLHQANRNDSMVTV